MLIIRMLSPEILASLVATDERRYGAVEDEAEESAKPACEIVDLGTYRDASVQS